MASSEKSYPISVYKKFKGFYSDNKLLFISLRVSLEQGVQINHPKTLNSKLYIEKTSSSIQVTGNEKKNLKIEVNTDSSQQNCPSCLGEVQDSRMSTVAEIFHRFYCTFPEDHFCKIGLRFLQVYFL